MTVEFDAFTLAIIALQRGLLVLIDNPAALAFAALLALVTYLGASALRA